MQHKAFFQLTFFSNYLHDRKCACYIRIDKQNKVFLVGHEHFLPEKYCTFVFSDEDTCNRLLSSLRLLDFGEAYFSRTGDSQKYLFDIEGNINHALDILEILKDVPRTIPERIRDYVVNFIHVFLLTFTKIHQKAIHHYEAPPEKMYRNFLDINMQYTCGLFLATNDSIDSAQKNKFTLIKEWLDLKPNQRHLDIGCGWGGLMKYFVVNYKTTSCGITNSDKMANYIYNYKKEALLVELHRKPVSLNTFPLQSISILHGDYSDFEFNEFFDVITIVGMLEHVPKARQYEFFQYLYRVVKPGGKIYLQCITRSPFSTLSDGTRFLQKYIFPGYFLEKVETLVLKIRKSGLVIDRMENHTEHYKYTCEKWLENLANNKHRILMEDKNNLENNVTEEDYRKHVAYLSFATRLFVKDGKGELFRFLIHKPVCFIKKRHLPDI